MEHDCCRQENTIDKDRVIQKQPLHQGWEHPSTLFLFIGLLLVGAVLVQAYNFSQINQLSLRLEKSTAALSLSGNAQQGGAIDTTGWTANEKMNYEMHGTIPARARASSAASGIANSPVTATFSDVSPKGIPRIYGSELGISYNGVSPNDAQKADETIAILSQFDQEKNSNFITLTGELEQRYITITSQIACEYCCGAKSLVFPDGKPACGCAHSYSMRGLAKYLLKNHSNEFTDDQILEELGKWKTLYFPGVLSQKAQVLKEKGVEFNYTNLSSNKYRGIEKGAQGGAMVGGC